MKFRRINGEPRYGNAKGFGTHLYNTKALSNGSRRVGVCEGEFDAMVCTAIGGLPCVGIPGATQWKGRPEWAELFEGKTVVIIPDIDRKSEGRTPGEDLADAIAESLDSVRIVRLPEPDEGEEKTDVTSYYLKHGKEKLCQLLRS